MADEVEVRPARPDDEPCILELMQLSLGQGGVPRSRAYWRWKHEQNPFGASPCLLAIAGNQVVGLRVFMRWQWQLDGRVFHSVRAVDTATHPDWRGRGIFTRLTLEMLSRMDEEGVSFVFNTPNQKSRPGYLKMGWKDVGRVSLWIRPLRPLRLLGGLLGREVSTGGDLQSGQEGDDELGREVRELVEDGGIEDFLEAVAPPPYKLTTPRTASYLRWRYGDIPGIRYRAVWHIDGPVGAAIVFRLRGRGSGLELRMCEFLMGRGGESAKLARALVRDLIRRSRADFIAAMTVTGGPRASLLVPLGFVPAPRLGPILTVRTMKDHPPHTDLVRRGTWHASIGDLELF